MDLDQFLERRGPRVEPTSLRSQKARDLSSFVAENPAVEATFVEARSVADLSSVVIEMRIPVGQTPVNDIRPYERLLLSFDDHDASWPAVYSLRSDFPTNVTHLNAPFNGEPPTLCLSIEAYTAFRRRWSPGRYIELLRRWLRDTSRGSLHESEQAVEPFLLVDASILIVPFSLRTKVDTAQRWFAVELAPSVYRLIPEQPSGTVTVRIAVLTLVAPKRVHGAIAPVPQTLEELASLIDDGTFSLRKHVTDAVTDWITQQRRPEIPLALLQIPISRELGGEVEYYEIRAFKLGHSVQHLGVQLAILDEKNPQGFLIRSEGATGRTEINIEVFNVHTSLTWRTAAAYNGESSIVPKYAIIGVGALGSQIAMNLTRGGATPDAVVDQDRFLPHNLARHALGGDAIGLWKAEAMAALLGSIVDDGGSIEGRTVDLLRENVTSLHAVDTILDVSASVDVARHLAHHEPALPRSISLFLSPRGTDLVLLAENGDRSCRLDMLEMQYYWDVATRDDLADHLAISGYHRYGASCRDVSGVLKQTSIAVCAGIGAAAFRRASSTPEAVANIWRLDEETGTVSRIDLAPQPMHSMTIGDWSVLIAKQLLVNFVALREKRLPNETGGVLIGSVDMERRIIYVVGTIAGPRDSVECPTAYVRGAFGLDLEIARLATATSGNLEYVGEWHSHPPGHSAEPSLTDHKLYEWLTEMSKDEGIPPTMFIVGAAELCCLVNGVREIVRLRS